MKHYKCAQCKEIGTNGIKCEHCGSYLVKLIETTKQKTLFGDKKYPD